MKFSLNVVFLLPMVVDASVRGVRGRNLQLQLVGFGGEPDASRFPLKQCQGDCDNDAEVGATNYAIFILVMITGICLIPS